MEFTIHSQNKHKLNKIPLTPDPWAPLVIETKKRGGATRPGEHAMARARRRRGGEARGGRADGGLRGSAAAAARGARARGPRQRGG